MLRTASSWRRNRPWASSSRWRRHSQVIDHLLRLGSISRWQFCRRTHYWTGQRPRAWMGGTTRAFMAPPLIWIKHSRTLRQPSLLKTPKCKRLKDCPRNLSLRTTLLPSRGVWKVLASPSLHDLSQPTVTQLLWIAVSHKLAPRFILQATVSQLKRCSGSKSNLRRLGVAKSSLKSW